MHFVHVRCEFLLALPPCLLRLPTPPSAWLGAFPTRTSPAAWPRGPAAGRQPSGLHSCMAGHVPQDMWRSRLFVQIPEGSASSLPLVLLLEFGLRIPEWQRVCLVGNSEISTQHHLVPSWFVKTAVGEC